MAWFDPSNDASTFPTDDEFKANVENKSMLEWDLPNKIHCAWEIPCLGFMWYITYYDPNTKLAYGWVSLGDREKAEWGTISIAELRDIFNTYKNKLKQLFPMTETFKNGALELKDVPFRYDDWKSVIELMNEEN